MRVYISLDTDLTNIDPDIVRKQILDLDIAHRSYKLHMRIKKPDIVDPINHIYWYKHIVHVLKVI